MIALTNKWKVIIGVFLAFFVSLFGFTKIPFIFFPDSDRNLITIDINLPQGNKIESTTKVVKAIEQYMLDSLKVKDTRTTGVLDWSSYIGEGPESYDLGYSADEANSNYAHILVNTSSFNQNNNMIAKIDNFTFNNFPNADIKVGSLGAGGGGFFIFYCEPTKSRTLKRKLELLNTKIVNFEFEQNGLVSWKVRKTI